MSEIDPNTSAEQNDTPTSNSITNDANFSDQLGTSDSSVENTVPAADSAYLSSTTGDASVISNDSQNIDTASADKSLPTEDAQQIVQDQSATAIPLNAAQNAELFTKDASFSESTASAAAATDSSSLGNTFEPTGVTKTDSGIILTFPPGSSGVYNLGRGMLINVTPIISPEDGSEQPVTVFVANPTRDASPPEQKYDTGSQVFQKNSETSQVKIIEVSRRTASSESEQDASSSYSAAASNQDYQYGIKTASQEASPEQHAVFDLWISGFIQGIDMAAAIGAFKKISDLTSVINPELFANDFNPNAYADEESAFEHIADLIMCGNPVKLIKNCRQIEVVNVVYSGLINNICSYYDLGISMKIEPGYSVFSTSQNNNIFSLKCVPGSQPTEEKRADFVNILNMFEQTSVDPSNVFDQLLSGGTMIVECNLVQILYVLQDQLVKKGVFTNNIATDGNGNQYTSSPFELSAYQNQQMDPGGERNRGSREDSGGNGGAPNTMFGENVIFKDEDGKDVSFSFTSPLGFLLTSMPISFYPLFPMYTKGFKDSNSLFDVNSLTFVEGNSENSDNMWNNGFYKYSFVDSNKEYIIKQKATSDDSIVCEIEFEDKIFTKILEGYKLSMFTRDFSSKENENDHYKLLLGPGVLKLTNSQGDILFKEVGFAADRHFYEDMLRTGIDLGPINETLVFDQTIEFHKKMEELILKQGTNVIDLVMRNYTPIPIFGGSTLTDFIRGIKEKSQLFQLFAMLPLYISFINTLLLASRGTVLTKDEILSYLSFADKDVKRSSLMKNAFFDIFTGRSPIPVDQNLIDLLVEKQHGWYIQKNEDSNFGGRMYSFAKNESPGSYIFNESIVLSSDQPLFSEIASNANILARAHTKDGEVIVRCDKIENGWKLTLDEAIQTNTWIQVLLTSKRDSLAMTTILMFFVKVEDDTQQNNVFSARKAS